MGNNSKHKFDSLFLTRWVLIGLFIRLILMPIAFHGSDLFFTYYAPFKLITQGVFDPYLYLHEHFSEFSVSYYPPVTYYFFSLVLLCIKGFLAKLNMLYSIFETHYFNHYFNTVHYAALLENADIMRTLFFFKIPYLLADFAIGFMLLKFLKNDNRQSHLAFKFWMLNPFVLHSCYLVGQSDIIGVLFVIAAVLFMLKDKAYLSVILLCLGAGTKVYPALLIPPAILLMGDTLQKRVKLSLVCLASLLILFLPFYLHSKGLIVGSYNAYGTFIPLRKIGLISCYILWLLFLLFFKRDNMKKIDCLVPIFSITLLLFYTVYFVTLRHFILVTPFLIYAMIKKRRFLIYNLVILITLFWLRTAGNTQQWGLFSVLYPEFFSGLPIMDSFINLKFNVYIIHKILYRIFFLTGMVMILDLFLGIRKNFKIPFLKKI